MFNLRFAKDYLLHRFKAKTRHGLHSPFVYHLADTVIYDFDDKKVYAEIENIRQQLLIDNRIITTTDLGAGSRVNERDLAAQPGIPLGDEGFPPAQPTRRGADALRVHGITSGVGLVSR